MIATNTSIYSFAALVGALVSIGAAEVGAVSAKVKFACARDYMAHCRAHTPDSAEARRCMNGIGEKLSSRCVNALVAAGEVSQAEVKRRAASLGN